MKDINIRKAIASESTNVIEFYYDLIDCLQGPDSPIRWMKGIYPVKDDIDRFIENGEMYIAQAENKIVGAFALNHSQGEGYERVSWKVKSENNDTAVLHLLAVSPTVHGRGLGSILLSEAVQLSKAMGDITMRLDTLPFNTPGRRLYEKFGFDYCGDVTLDYPSTGKIDFSMYEFDYSKL